jgi:outer membrane lipoprotein SlyB
MKVFSILALTAAIAFGVACTPNVSPDSYSVGAVGQVNRVVRGKIISARPVQIAGTQTGVGSGAGAAAGAVGGSFVGGDIRSNVVGAIGGAVVGGVAGALLEEGASRQKGMEYVVETENGAVLTVVQGEDAALIVGQNVLVMYGSRSRVIADPSR